MIRGITGLVGALTRPLAALWQRGVSVVTRIFRAAPEAAPPEAAEVVEAIREIRLVAAPEEFGELEIALTGLEQASLLARQHAAAERDIVLPAENMPRVPWRLGGKAKYVFEVDVIDPITGERRTDVVTVKWTGVRLFSSLVEEARQIVEEGLLGSPSRKVLGIRPLEVMYGR